MAKPFHKLYVKVDGVARFFDEKDDKIPIRIEQVSYMYEVTYDGNPKIREEIIKRIKSKKRTNRNPRKKIKADNSNAQELLF